MLRSIEKSINVCEELKTNRKTIKKCIYLVFSHGKNMAVLTKSADFKIISCPMKNVINMFIEKMYNYFSLQFYIYKRKQL